MNVFDIIGPIMIGPSSSHTAGAVRLGRVANKVLHNEKPVSAVMLLGMEVQNWGSIMATSGVSS